jgi:predicted outer membrane protein
MRGSKSYVRWLCCLSLCGALASGCSDDDDDDGKADSGARLDAGADASTGANGSDGGIDASIDAAVDGGGSPGTIAVDAATVVLSPAQVVGVAAALNTGEIEAGTLAQGKAVSTAAKDYASMMVTMHTAAQQRQAALGVAPAPSPEQMTVTTMAATALQNLQTLPAGPSFDTAYLESQVLMHTNARNLIDNLLLPNAANAPALRDELTRTRGEVVAHLTQAMALLGDGGVSGADAGTMSLDAGNDAGS